MAFVVPLTLPIPDKILVRGREKIGYGKRIVALSTSCKHQVSLHNQNVLYAVWCQLFGFPSYAGIWMIKAHRQCPKI